MNAVSIHPPAAVVSPKKSLQRAWLWTMPLLLSASFAAGFVVWAITNEAADRDEARKTLISDALSVDAQLRGRIESEATHLRIAADQLRNRQPSTELLATNAEVVAGLRRFWLNVIWLDGRNRIVANTPADVAAQAAGGRGLEEDGGLSMHLTAPIQNPLPEDNGAADNSAGMLVVRYSPTALLKRGVPWWLSRKYDVRLVDSYDEVIASTADLAAPPGIEKEGYQVSFTGPALRDMFVRLNPRATIAPWYRTLPLVHVIGFLLLAVAATLLLRRQVRNVSRAESALRTEVAWRRAMEESALVGLRARDLNGRVLHVNRTFCELVGYDKTSLVGIAPPMPYWPPAEIEDVLVRHRRTLAGDAPRDGYHARWQHRDGSRLDVMVFESPLVDADGVQIGWMGSIVDVTETKRLEERERHQTETSAHHARLTMLGEIASALAHELNQPLTAISSYAAGIENSVKRHTAPDDIVLSAIDRLAKQADHAGRIVKRIREFLTRRVPQYQASNLNMVVEDAIELQRRLFESKGIRLVRQFDENLPEVMVDRILIEQVILNLIRNAADATSTQAGERVLHVSTHRASAEFVRVTVADSGPGLASRTIDKLCEPFYTTKPEGMGMGLAICRSIIEAHRGVLDAWDGPDGGAVISFSLQVNALLTSET